MHIQGRRDGGLAGRAARVEGNGNLKKQEKSLQIMFVSVYQQC